MSNSSRGRFVWYDLMTSDPKGAEAFYPKAVNWGVQPWDQMAYSMWTANGQPLGGVMELPKEAGAPPHWLAYVSVPDVDGACSLAESLGGKVLKPGADIPNVGRFAILEDPHGARLAVFTSAQPAQPDNDPAVGEFSWHELATKDYKQAFSFYEALFGWERSAEHDMGPLGDGITQGNATGALMRTAPLWGLRTQATLLHDGRATTVTDAIEAHAGQAAAARAAFDGLTAVQRAKLLEFLGSL